MRRPLLLLAPLLLTGLLGLPGAGPASAALPGYTQWVRDTKSALNGSRVYVTDRVEKKEAGEKLALNLDIDNTSLATHYRPGQAVYYTLRLARHAQARGVSVLFNTARTDAGLPRAVEQLQAAGFRVDGICGRHQGESLVEGKQRCRAEYAERGYTLIANVGNRSTDFTGSGYERRYKLPDYGKQLS